jgi:hypothetical protein
VWSSSVEPVSTSQCGPMRHRESDEHDTVDSDEIDDAFTLFVRGRRFNSSSASPTISLSTYLQAPNTN